MNLVELQKKLIVAARKQVPGDHVPCAFEQRIMARLAAAPKVDEWAWWGRALWRGAAACVAITVLIGVWSVLPVNTNAASSDLDLSEHLEYAILASADEVEANW